MKGINSNILLLLVSLLCCFMQSCSIGDSKNVEDKKEDTILVLNRRKVHIIIISEDKYRKALKAEQKNADNTSVVKNKGELKLDLANNKKVFLKYSLVDSDNIEEVTYTYLEHLKDVGFYVIKAQHYETSEYLLINDKTGDKVKIWGKPKLSPDKKHIVASSNSLGYDAMPNGIQMWSLESGALKLDWEYKQDEWESDSILWAGNSSFYFIKKIPDFVSKTREEEKYYMALTME